MKTYAMLNMLKKKKKKRKKAMMDVLILTPKSDGLFSFTSVFLTQLHESKLFSDNLGNKYHMITTTDKFRTKNF